MTIEEMKNLKIGDLVEDLELPIRMNYSERIICRIDEADEWGVIINSLEAKYEKSYPHRFSFSQFEKLKKI